MVLREILVYDERFGTFLCDNTTLPYAGNITCILSYNVTNIDIVNGQPLDFIATVQLPALLDCQGTVSSMPVSVPVFSNPLLVADIVAQNCTPVDPDMGECRQKAMWAGTA
jgi:hypothetical protein